MTTSNQQLVGDPLDARPTYVDSIELRIRGRLNRETYIRATPDSAIQMLRMPSSSDWDWYPAQIRFLVKSPQIPGSSSSVASSSEDRNIERAIPKSATMQADKVELRVREQSGYEMYIRAAPNSAILNLDVPSSNDWGWHGAQIHFLHKEPQAPSQTAPTALAKAIRASSTDLASAIERGVRDSRSDPGSLMVPADVKRRKLFHKGLTLKFLRMELKLRRSFSVDSASTEFSARTNGDKMSKTTIGSFLIFEDLLNVIDERWGKEWYMLRLENSVGGDSIEFDTIPESLAIIPRNDDFIKVIFRKKLRCVDPVSDISVRIKFDTSELVFIISTTLKLGILFKAACELWQVIYEKVRFFVNGRRVTGDETPESVEMDSEDAIETYLALVGGGPTEKSEQRNHRSTSYVAPSIEETSNAIIPEAQEAAEERLSELDLDIKPNIIKSNDETATEDVILFLPPASGDKLPGTPATAGGKQPQNKRGMTIKVKDDTESEIFFNVMPHTKFSVVIKACEKHWDKMNLRFFSPDGPRILPDDTPHTLGLEEGDQISALIQTWGGC